MIGRERHSIGFIWQVVKTTRLEIKPDDKLSNQRPEGKIYKKNCNNVPIYNIFDIP